MAKGRMLQNRISKSRRVNALESDTARLLYTWMLSHLDVNGCFYADPQLVKNIVFPRLKHTVKKIQSCLDELNEAGLIILYENDKERYLYYPDFKEKQTNLYPDREGKPDIPKPTTNLLQTNYKSTPAETKGNEKKGKESNISETKSSSLHLEPADSSDSEISEFKTAFTKQFGKEFTPTKGDLRTWFKSNNGLREEHCLYFNRTWIEIMYYALAEMKLVINKTLIKNPITFFNGGITARGSPPYILLEMKEHKQDICKRE